MSTNLVVGPYGSIGRDKSQGGRDRGRAEKHPESAPAEAGAMSAAMPHTPQEALLEEIPETTSALLFETALLASAGQVSMPIPLAATRRDTEQWEPPAAQSHLRDKSI
ncbi:MAG TPA: hypothetical protein VIL84_14220 [Devosiaceae bacterium]